MLPLAEPALRRYWHPVLPLTELEHQPCAFTLLGTDLVLWKGADGTAQAALDRCCHRSVRLSLGEATAAGELQCAYHGWRFDGSGRCTAIPQQPGEPIPERARLRVFPCRERYGYAWVCLDPEPLAPLPLLPQEDDPAFRRFHGFWEEWACPAVRYVENALDNSHHYFVHHGLLDTVSPVPPVIEAIQETDEGLSFALPLHFASNPVLRRSITSDAQVLANERLTRWIAPFGVVLSMQWPNGLIHHIVSFMVPKDDRRSQFVRFYFRNDAAPPDQDAEVIGFDRKLTLQDRRILETIDPDSPLDATSEASMAIDRPILMMRRLLHRRLRQADDHAPGT